ncbi:gibberellin 20 oxidase 2-like [Primulina tabacum]|uniref:gibberellin 20 oxidase 2-like n=1 Tax=Primulina tabacum TaxID=48773 RepID=UPI003F5AAA8C
MDSSASTLNLHPSSSHKANREKKGVLIFDTSIIEKQENFPAQFLWPHEDLAYVSQDELNEHPIDLKGFFNGDLEAISLAAKQVRVACLNHGFFQVINHGVGASAIRTAYEHMDAFFKLPLSKKLAQKRKPGDLCGYSGAHADRFSSKLPWKETFSFTYEHEHDQGLDVVDYIKSVMGEEFEDAGIVYQEYCEAMKNLSLVIFELLAISLGVDRFHFRRFFEDGVSIMRGNNYPPCKKAGLTFGTGPHFDPNSLTILHQDQVGGLEIYSDNKWRAIRPRPDAFVVNIGDTFVALSNGRYKSCLHRAVVNKDKTRRSLVFFVNPKEDKKVRPPEDLMRREETSKYPDFTWSDLRDFTQNHYRADTATLQNFVQWLRIHKPSKKTQP